MSDRMSNAPVYYALAQAQFNPIAAMATYVDQVQDRLRREGYPLYEPHRATRLVVPGSGQEEARIELAESWLMTRSDRTAGFILGPAAITFHTTHYETHAQFIPELLRGLAAVHEVVALDHVSRLGLRYLNVVLPQADETVEQYLADGLHGINVDAARRYDLSESVFETDTGPLLPKGTLVARVHRMTAPLGVPSDMVPHSLLVNPKFDIKEALAHAAIDIDHYVEGRMPVERNPLYEQLISLHVTIKKVFRATTTDHAQGRWA